MSESTRSSMSKHCTLLKYVLWVLKLKLKPFTISQTKKMYTQFVLVIVRTILGYDGKVVHTQKAHRPHRSPDYNVKHSYSAKYLKLHIKYNNTMNTGQIVINVNLHFQCHFWSICATFPPQNAMVKFPLNLGFSELACFHIDITNFSLYLLRIFFISYFSYHLIEVLNWCPSLTSGCHGWIYMYMYEMMHRSMSL